MFIGRVLDSRYRVEELVARGGMATVYRASDSRLGRSVAIKVLSGSLITDPGFVDRFTQEARAAASLTHPNVVAVHDQGIAEGFPYLVMEFVPGRTIREVLVDHGPFASAHALEIISSVLAGLASAHDAGFVHRDIKPENVLITAQGHVKVTDFGLARVINDTPVSDSTGAILLGTMAYLSPEQVQQRSLDARSDVYSAGILLFEMLTGRVPFTGTSPLDVAYQHVSREVPAPSSYAPEIPPAIDHLVLAATRKDPNDRIQSAQVFLEGAARAIAAVPAAEAITVAINLAPTIRIPLTEPARVSRDTSSVAMRQTGAHRAERGSTSHTSTNVVVGKHSTRRVAVKRKRKPLRFVLLLASLAAIGALWYTFTGSYVHMPNVVGQSSDTAVSTLNDLGLSAKITKEFSEDVPKGIVIRTKPSPDTKARKGKAVSVYVSKGQERYLIPTDVVGKNPTDVQAQLEALTLTVAATRQDYSDTVKVGSVITTDPAGGARVKRGADVTIIISKGPAPVVIPPISGLDLKVATTQLAALGLKISVTEQLFDDSAAGSILQVDPLPGQTVPKGSTVRVTVSKGPALVDVPNVVGMDVKEAKQLLTDAGFQIKTEKQLAVVILNKVYSQSANGQAPKGSLIILKIV